MDGLHNGPLKGDRGLIRLVLSDEGRIEQEVIVVSPLPPSEPLAKPGEIYMSFDGDDTAVTDFLIFFAKKFDKGDIIPRSSYQNAVK